MDQIAEETKLPVLKKRRKGPKHGLWVDWRNVRLDKRTSLAKSIDRMRGELAKHVGGSPSVVQCILIERICFKSVQAYLYETNFLWKIEQGSEKFYLALVNSLRLDCVALGIQSTATNKVADLSQYLQETYGEDDDKQEEQASSDQEEQAT